MTSLGRRSLLPPTASGLRAMLLAICLITALLLLLAPTSQGREKQRGPCRGLIPHSNGWTTVLGPKTYLGDYAINPSRPRIMFALHIAKVLRSTEGGCRWKDAGVRDVVTDITSDTPAYPWPMQVVVSPSNARFAYAVMQNVALLRKPYSLFASRDYGATWTNLDMALPLTLDRLSLFSLGIAPSSHRVLYLMGGQRSGLRDHETGTFIYKSDDAGATWEVQSKTPLPNQFGYLQMLIDPSDPARLWLWNRFVILKSQDSGRTFKPVVIKGSAGRVSGALDIAVMRPRGGGSVVAVVPPTTYWPRCHYPCHRSLFMSYDSGRSWAEARAPGDVLEVTAWGRRFAFLIAPGGQRYRIVYSWSRAEGWRPLPQPPRGDVFRLRSDSATPPGLYLQTEGTIERFSPSRAKRI